MFYIVGNVSPNKYSHTYLWTLILFTVCSYYTKYVNADCDNSLNMIMSCLFPVCTMITLWQ